MTQSHDAWILRAEAEYHSASREFHAATNPNFAATCYHSLQCVLRYLQARLQQEKIPFPSTPHPVVLLECCLELEPEWEIYRSDLRTLHVNAMDTLDVELGTAFEQAEQSFLACARFREVAQDTLGV